MKILLMLFLLGSLPLWANDLIINAVELGIGKFHRYNNSLHLYDDQNVWKALILPDDHTDMSPLIKQNGPNNFTIFFTNLEQLLQLSINLANNEAKQIEVFNIISHGVPGGMWTPVDEVAQESLACAGWGMSTSGSDEENYLMYYSELSVEAVEAVKSIGDLDQLPENECLSGAPEWKMVINRNPQFRNILSSTAQIHFLSCLVGHGDLGRTFTFEVAGQLLSSPGQQVQTAISFGIGDWSMPDGMGFWDMTGPEQVEADNILYQTNKNDSEIKMKSDIRVAFFGEDTVLMGYIFDQDYMYFTLDQRPITLEQAQYAPVALSTLTSTSAIIPHTNVRFNF